MSNYRNRKLLNLIATLPCMCCDAEDGTIVPAHSNALTHGRGASYRSHDVYAAALCMRCHDLVDGRAGKLSKEDKRDMWQRAWERTMLELWQRGLLEVRR